MDYYYLQYMNFSTIVQGRTISHPLETLDILNQFCIYPHWIALYVANFDQLPPYSEQHIHRSMDKIEPTQDSCDPPKTT